VIADVILKNWGNCVCVQLLHLQQLPPSVPVPGSLHHITVSDIIISSN
jgi:hypothetical protein